MVKMRRFCFLVFMALASIVAFAQFRSKQDVYNYLEGKTFSYYNHFMISFHNGMLSMDWDANYKCKMNVISFSQNTARLTGTIRIGYLRGDLLYNLEMSLDKRNNEFTLIGSPEDGTYKLAPQTDAPRPNSFDDKVYEAGQTDRMADFPNGGEVAMCQWLAQNVKYPSLAEQRGEKGRVLVSFIVDKDGSITYPKIKTSVSETLDAEALRVIKKMPKWIPAVKNGKTVKMIRVVSITFR